MSELFSRLQQGLRDFKNNHDIDMSHPNGSIIYGKPYPAINKVIWMNTNTFDASKKPSNYFHYGFDIPLENGHRVSVVKHNREGMAIQSKIKIPTTYLFKQPDGKNLTSNAHRIMHINGNDKGIPEHLKEPMAGVNHDHSHENNDMFHDYVKSVSRLPRFGTVVYHSSKASFQSHRAMTNDELNEHFQNTRNNLRQEEYPHNIHVYLEEEKRIRQYDYDIKTEQLTTDEEWE